MLSRIIVLAILAAGSFACAGAPIDVTHARLAELSPRWLGHDQHLRDYVLHQ